MKGRFTGGPPDPDAPKSKFVYEEQNTAPAEVPNQLASVLNVATQKSSDVQVPERTEESEIEIGHARAIKGNDVTVAVAAGHKRTLTRVVTKLDGFGIGDDPVSGQRYRRHFQMQGDASEGLLHKVEVSATDSSGEVARDQDVWTDLD